MWLFCIKTQLGTENKHYSIGFLQGSAGVWVEIMTVTKLESALKMVNFLNGGDGRDVKFT
jgi:hypothetical protein